MRFIVIATMILTASLASADTRIAVSGEPRSGSGEEQLEPAKEVVVKWWQDPVFGGNAISSELRTSDGYWAPVSDLSTYTEFAFMLYGDVTNPVEESSWGSIKAMFR